MRLHDVPQFEPRHARPYRAHARAVRERTGPGRAGVRRRRGGRMVLDRAEIHLPRPGQLTDDPACPGRRRVVGGLLRGAAGVPAPRTHAPLLDGAVGHAHAMGATVLEGYPVDPGRERVDQTSGYVGTVPLFEAHGFERVSQTSGRRGGKPRWLVAASFPDLSSLGPRLWRAPPASQAPWNGTAHPDLRRARRPAETCASSSRATRIPAPVSW